MSKELTLQEAALAWAQGKRVEAAWKPDDGKLGRWGLIYNFTTGVGEYWPVIFNDPKGWHFRLAPEPPAKRYRPWTPEEVPVGAAIRKKGVSGISVILSNGATRETGVSYISSSNSLSLATYAAALEFCEHSIDPIGTPDSKRTWLPCGVEVSE